MVRNRYYVVRKLANVIYALPVGQGIIDQYPVMELGALEYDIVSRCDQDENQKEIFQDMAINYKIPEEERDVFWEDYCTAIKELASCNILVNVKLEGET